MTGAEHYREAERLIARATDDETGRPLAGFAELYARAQVHATLALATRAGGIDPGYDPERELAGLD